MWPWWTSGRFSSLCSLYWKYCYLFFKIRFLAQYRLWNADKLVMGQFHLPLTLSYFFEESTISCFTLSFWFFFPRGNRHGFAADNHSKFYIRLFNSALGTRRIQNAISQHGILLGCWKKNHGKVTVQDTGSSLIWSWQNNRCQQQSEQRIWEKKVVAWSWIENVHSKYTEWREWMKAYQCLLTKELGKGDCKGDGLSTEV